MARSMPKDISFPVPVEVEKQITECDDPVVLASWLSRATTVSEVAESVAAKMPWFVVNDENRQVGNLARDHVANLMVVVAARSLFSLQCVRRHPE